MSILPEWNNAQYQPLTIVLRNIIQDYQAGPGILLELCQNADDAGASEIEFVLDREKYPEKDLLHDELAQYQGASLLAFNNRLFEPEDFASLRRIGDSGKADDPNSTGKFGKGFNSVCPPPLLIRHLWCGNPFRSLIVSLSSPRYITGLTRHPSFLVPIS